MSISISHTLRIVSVTSVAIMGGNLPAMPVVSSAFAQTVASSEQADRRMEERPLARHHVSSPGLITGRERLRWFAESTVSPGALASAASSAAWKTMRQDTEFYGRGPSEFGRRYAARMGDSAVRTGLEAGLGALWHEDPRYVRSRARNPFARVGHAMRLGVMAPRPGGRLAPAYARYAAIVGTSAAATAWRPKHERSMNDVLANSASGLIGAVTGNIFSEFWPDIRSAVLRRQ